MAKRPRQIKVKGNMYLRLYDDKGNLSEDVNISFMSQADVEESIKELEAVDLMEVIEHKGVKYFRMLEPKSKGVPFNVLNN
ncbi:hypothetical protein [Staphylococcus equorum]|uniref:Uncharacterized protein n=1 Tax=Staphylococcus equorum TaxID=246432 RepID=A0AAP7IFG8_9STAP|nr:hypothetical protein [Staphylococcus equorum]OEK58980.1 hypothetical protein ASS94_01245 [Staphylococcus equorum]